MPSKHKPTVTGLRIERGVPIPQAKSRMGYAEFLRQMKPGDSVLFPLSDNVNAVRKRAMQTFGKGCYAVRTLKEGIRLWRTK